MNEESDLPGPREPTELTTTDTAPPPSIEGQRVGPYRLLQRLGEGGMGEVWLAEQNEPVRRRVALKIIKQGMDTKQVVARFEAERQALAVMDHPLVAKVFDAGTTPEGRPYFAMEYVPGVPITEHCDRQNLTTEKRLRLFMQVCEGVQHAHHKAIIHRDLKPSNVLVSTQGGRTAPKVIDFGVAKAIAQRLTERSFFTELGVLIGTPEYMSPEQAEMTAQDVDTRTDVYSLGVMLYELLVGALPFDPKALRAAGFDEIRRKIREEEPPKPTTRLSTMGEAASTDAARKRRVDLRTLRRQLSGDLDWITMKALEKDRSRRYGSPAELAADIERHLADQPVLAGPPSATYRTRKFVRRHTMGVSFTTAAVLLLLAFAVTMAWQARRIARERDRADREARTANRALDFLTGLFKESGPDQARGKTITAREILDRGAIRLRSDLANEPTSQARLMLTVGNVYVDLGLYDSAQPLLERSLSLRRKLLGDNHADTLKSIAAIGNLLYAQGKNKEAETYFREALEGRRQTLGDDDPDTMNAIQSVALVLDSQGKYEESETYYRRALAGLRKVQGNDHENTLNGIANLGAVLFEQGKLKEAEAYLREALEGRRRVLGNDHPDTLSSIANITILLREQGKLKEAEAYVREALEGKRRVLGNDHPDTLNSISHLGAVLDDEGKLKEAEAYVREALEGRRRVLGNDHPDTLSSIYNIGVLLRQQGKLKEAESYSRKALEVRRRVLGNDHLDTINSIDEVGVLLRQQGKLKEAELLFREAVEGSSRVLGMSHSDTLRYMSDLGDLYAAQGRLEEAERLLRETVAGAKTLPEGGPVVGALLNKYGRCLSLLKRYPEAEAALLEAHKILASADVYMAHEAEQNLVALYEAWGKHDKAAEWRSKM